MNSSGVVRLQNNPPLKLKPHVGGSTACSTTADHAPTPFWGAVWGERRRRAVVCVNSRGAAARAGRTSKNLPRGPQAGNHLPQGQPSGHWHRAGSRALQAVPRHMDARVHDVWEYELYGGARLAPHRLYVFARLLTPPKGVWEGPRAIVTSLGTRGVGFFPRPLVPSLPRRHVLGKCACFCAEGIGSPSPAKAKEGGLSCGGANNNNHM
eukprot:scaffold3499_cov117-Isochrysis_galbana.AAC.10